MVWQVCFFEEERLREFSRCPTLAHRCRRNADDGAARLIGKRCAAALLAVAR